MTKSTIFLAKVGSRVTAAFDGTMVDTLTNLRPTAMEGAAECAARPGMVDAKAWGPLVGQRLLPWPSIVSASLLLQHQPPPPPPLAMMGLRHKKGLLERPARPPLQWKPSCRAHRLGARPSLQLRSRMLWAFSLSDRQGLYSGPPPRLLVGPLPWNLHGPWRCRPLSGHLPE